MGDKEITGELGHTVLAFLLHRLFVCGWDEQESPDRALLYVGGQPRPPPQGWSKIPRLANLGRPFFHFYT